MAAGVPHRRTPFPALPPATAEAFGGGALWLRRFGTAGEDLAIDLAGPSGPSLVTAVLAACTGRDDGPPPPEGFFWALEVGTRVEALLRLLALDDVEELAAVTACAGPGCGQPIEIALQVGELVALQEARPEGPVTVATTSGGLRLRRPTGEDQRRWAAMRFADAEAARRAILRDLALDGDTDPARVDLAAAERALDDADPLVDFSLAAHCPFCGTATGLSLDLTALALARLRRSQSGLFETVHLLASRYHWSEGEILSIPAWRRSRYLSLIDREGSA